jgi:hypothetical protein
MHHRSMLKASAGLALVLGLGLTALLLGLGPRPAGAQSPAQPFRVSFTAQPEGDGARITGDVYNGDARAVDDVRLRIIELDLSGYAMASYVEPLLGMVPASGSAHFDVRVPNSDAASYRVIVESWKTVDEPAK